MTDGMEATPEEQLPTEHDVDDGEAPQEGESVTDRPDNPEEGSSESGD